MLPSDSPLQARVQGLPDLREALQGVVPKLRRQALRNALAAGARLVRDEARRRVPVLAQPIRNRAGQVIRKPGTVRNAISVRTSKDARRMGDVGVFVNVRPAQGARYRTVTQQRLGGLIKARTRVRVRASKRGRYSPDDPFFWRFIEFGTSRGVRGFGFLQRAAGRLGDALEVFKARIGPAIDKLNGGKSAQI